MKISSKITDIKGFLTIIIFLAILIPFPASAQTTSNENYTIQTKDFEQKTFHPQVQENPTGRRIIKADNFQAVLGFEDIVADELFSIDSSSSFIDYGRLYPTNPVIRDMTIDIDSASTHGYSVVAYENHSLADSSFTNLIPNTSCDKGLCSLTTSAIWSDSLTYGFGYRCESIKKILCSGFNGENSFKKHPDESKSEEYQSVFQGGQGRKGEGKIIYKLNIPISQANIGYSNKINYIALPNL